jgi:hypothetical protein
MVIFGSGGVLSNISSHLGNSAIGNGIVGNGAGCYNIKLIHYHT